MDVQSVVGGLDPVQKLSSHAACTLPDMLLLRPPQAKSAHQSAQTTRQLGRARNAMEGALARAAAAGGSLTLRPSNKRAAASLLDGACKGRGWGT